MYRITDLSRTHDLSYIAVSLEDARDATDRSALAESMRLRDVITMGKIIVEPLGPDRLQQARKLIEEFMPYIGHVAEFDYGLLNEWLVWAEKYTRTQEV